MPSQEEMRVELNKDYYQLLQVKAKYKHSKEATNALNEVIYYKKASMKEPDISWVEKNFAEANMGQQ